MSKTKKFGGVVFTGSVLKSANAIRLSSEILTADLPTPELKKQIQKVFHTANRRIQNIEKSGVYSPAVKELEFNQVGQTQKFAKFTQAGQNWNDIKLQYAKAVQFLRKPTSTASGAKQWNKAIQKELGFNDGLYNAIIQQVNENGGNVPILETSNIDRAISQFERLAKRDVSDMIESEAQKQAENELLNALTNDVSKGIDKIAEKTILEGLKQFGIITDLM